MEFWQVTVENAVSGERSTIKARVLVNAGGPWVSRRCWRRGAGVHAKAFKVRLVQGSHIVVRKHVCAMTAPT